MVLLVKVVPEEEVLGVWYENLTYRCILEHVEYITFD